jgi:hypothetical protein
MRTSSRYAFVSRRFQWSIENTVGKHIFPLTVGTDSDLRHIKDLIAAAVVRLHVELPSPFIPGGAE